MAVSQVFVQRAFLSEVDWVKETIRQIDEYRSRNWAIGLNGDTGQPDGFTASFAARNLNCVAYIRAAGVSIGTPEAYEMNKAMLIQYIERERQEEIRVVNDVINQIESYKTRNWAIGLTWPDGQPDGFSRFFAVRELPIAFYLRGDMSVGDPSAYDTNTHTLQSYLQAVGQARIR